MEAKCVKTKINMDQSEQQFLNDLDKRLWTMANKLLPMLDAAVYKHVVLGLIFLKYVSDAFKERRAELEAAFRDPANDYYLGDDGAELIEQELEARDYYTEKNVFWVPALARWDFLQSNAKVAVGTVLQVKNGKIYRIQIQRHRPPARRRARSRGEGKPQTQGRAGKRLRPQADRLRTARA